jgi:hypothetical protein
MIVFKIIVSKIHVHVSETNRKHNIAHFVCYGTRTSPLEFHLHYLHELLF